MIKLLCTYVPCCVLYSLCSLYVLFVYVTYDYVHSCRQCLDPLRGANSLPCGTPQFITAVGNIWYMDSDAAPDPIVNDLSLSDAFKKWDKNLTDSVGFGKVLPSNATFLSNFPFRHDLPCAGTIKFKPTKFAQDEIREWWTAFCDPFSSRVALYVISPPTCLTYSTPGI
jgi:hypothetical protein